MWERFVRGLLLVLCAGLVAAPVPAQAESGDETIGFERTPPRLSFVDGEVSFWRQGAEEWTPARVNIALAAGDELYTDESANVELQVAPRAFVRAGEDTQLGLTSLEPDYLQLRLTEGTVSLDLRSLASGHTLEVGTPNAAFTVERSGYYRVEVDGDTTTFTSRRGGRATLAPAAGEPVAIAASEQVVVTGTDAPQLESYAAPELDAWDRWNYARTDDQLDAVSARYVPPAVYGAYELDHYGDWRIVASYGPVWVPRRVAVGWAPYSTGRWLFDPYYGWTWLDDAPWGWAPFHYGRWVHVSGYWGWCPGPIVVRPYYAPALVAFYGGGFSIGVSIARPHVGWVALGWGEPLVPWWGPRHFREHAHWAGWGGPRIVNKVRIEHKTVYKAKQINVYQNADVRDAIVAVDRDHFGRRSGKDARFGRVEAGKLKPVQGDFDVRPDRSSLVGEAKAARRPPKQLRERAVVATRAPKLDPEPRLEPQRAPKQKTGRAEAGPPDGGPPPRLVKPPREAKHDRVLERPPFGKQGESERSTPRRAPRYQKPAERKTKAPEPPTQAAPSPQRHERVARPERVEPPKPERSERVRPERSERAKPEGSDRAGPELPGEPANRVYRNERYEPHSSVPREHSSGALEPKPERSREEHGGGGKSRAGGGLDDAERGRGR